MSRQHCRQDVEYRIEHDTMGEVRVPVNALWRAQTQRAVENFPISGRGLERTQIRALGLLKGACAQVNKDLGLLDAEKADAIIAAADEVAAGLHDDQFPIDVFQTGSGTSSNMNTNEVIATHRRSGQRRDRAPQRPRQHVAVVERRLPDRHPHRRHGRRCARSDSGAARCCTSRWRPRPAVAHRREVRPHPPDGRRAGDAGPGVRRLRPPDRGTASSGSRPRCPGWVNCRSAAPPSAPASTRRPASARKVVEVLVEQTGLAELRTAREPFRGAGRPRRAGRGVRRAAHHRGRR